MKRLFALLLVATCASAATAAPMISLSTSATDPTATDIAPLMVGDSAELYIWITPDPLTKVNGASFDIVADPSGYVTASSININNPAILGAPAWQGNIKLGDVGGTDKVVDGSLAVAVTSNGINASLAGTGLDPRNVVGTSFLHGSLTVEGAAGGMGSIYAAANAANPFTVEGQGGVTFDAPAFAIEVVGEVIPEPATAGLAGLAIAGVLGFRRRR